MRLRTALAALVVPLLGGSAHAGRSFFAWSYGSELVPERGTEIETWIVEENKKDNPSGAANKRDETSFWWGPVMALTQHLELAIPIEAEYADEHDPAKPAGPAFTKWGAEVRYRPQGPDAIDSGPFSTLFRFGAKRLIQDRAGTRLEGDIVAGYRKDRIYLGVDLGSITERVPGANETEIRPSGGISIRAYDDLRFGIEGYGELIVEGVGTSWYVIGPTVSLTSGRFWGAATLGIGVLGIRDAPRLTFGVAL